MANSDVERLLSRLDRSGGPDACWPSVRGRLRRTGYAPFWLRGRSTSAHRAAYELLVGPVPEGAQVLHRCDVRACANPAHLFLGTHADNMADMVAKGRQARRGAPGSHAGERHGRWTLIEFVDFARRADGKDSERWRARCECGTEAVVHLANVTRGLSTSCGCYRREWASQNAKRVNAARAESARRAG